MDMKTATYKALNQSTMVAADSAVMSLAAGRKAREDAIIAEALSILERRVCRGDALSSPRAVRDFLRVLLAEEDTEHFVVVFVDTQNRVIAHETMFTGTLTQTSVYPRVIVQRALYYNAGAVLLCHNHPSGVTTASRADELLTANLKRALALVEVAVLDHFIVAGTNIKSFAEQGLL
jgi:DNA repair protein RadC